MLLLEISDRVEIRPIDKEELPQVKDWILNKHYIKRWPTGVQHKLGIYVDGKLAGSLLYGPPLYPQTGSQMFKDKDGKSLLKNNQALELLRAYTTDEAKEAIPNLGSMVISSGNDYVRKHGKTKQGLPIKAIVSYADPDVGHTGGVYKATNSHYFGPGSEQKALVITDPKHVEPFKNV